MMIISMMIAVLSSQGSATRDSRPVILAFGDSLTAGYGVPHGSTYPDQLQRKLDSLGYKYRIVNMGISGDTTSGGRARMQAALNAVPSIVILELGANDGLRGMPIAAMQTNLDQMIMDFQKTGAMVILAGRERRRHVGRWHPQLVSRRGMGRLLGRRGLGGRRGARRRGGEERHARSSQSR